MIDWVYGSTPFSAHWMNQNVLTGVNEIDNFVEIGRHLQEIFVKKKGKFVF